MKKSLFNFLILFSLFCAMPLFFPTDAFAQVLIEEGDEYYKKGKDFFNKGEYSESINFLNKALPLLTNYDYIVDTHKILAFIHVAFSEQEKAVFEFSEVLKLNPDLTLNPLTESPRVIEAYEKARKDLIDQGILIPKIVKEKAEGVKEADKNKTPSPAAKPPVEEKKEEEKEVVIEIDPSYTPPPKEPALPPPPKISPELKKKEFFRNAQNYINDQKFSLAADELGKALFEDPDFIEARILLAKIYNNTPGKHLTALDELKKTLAKEPDNVEGLMLIANIYVNKTMEYEKGLAELAKVLNLKCDHAPAYDLTGIIHYKNQEYSKAIKAYYKALEANPKLPHVHNHLGGAYMKTDRPSDALLEYLAAVEMDPSNLDFIEDLALAYEEAGHKHAAINEWRKFLDKNPPQLKRDLAMRHLESLK